MLHETTLHFLHESAVLAVVLHCLIAMLMFLAWRRLPRAEVAAAIAIAVTALGYAILYFLQTAPGAASPTLLSLRGVLAVGHVWSWLLFVQAATRQSSLTAHSIAALSVAVLVIPILETIGVASTQIAIQRVFGSGKVSWLVEPQIESGIGAFTMLELSVLFAFSALQTLRSGRIAPYPLVQYGLLALVVLVAVEAFAISLDVPSIWLAPIGLVFAEVPICLHLLTRAFSAEKSIAPSDSRQDRVGKALALQAAVELIGHQVANPLQEAVEAADILAHGGGTTSATQEAAQRLNHGLRGASDALRRLRNASPPLDFKSPPTGVVENTRVDVEKASSDSADSGHILVVDDDDAVRSSLVRVLQRGGFAVASASSGRAALHALRLRRADLVLTDLSMPEMSGIELVELIYKEFPALRGRVVVLTGGHWPNETVTTPSLESLPVLYKPIRPAALLDCVGSFLHQ